MKPLPADQHNHHQDYRRAGILFLLKLIILLCLLKLLFYFYNEANLGNPVFSAPNQLLTTLKWSLYYDLLVITFINTPLLMLLFVISYMKKRMVPALAVIILFFVLNIACILLNFSDVFYYDFHLQRADADLFYVLHGVFEKTFIRNSGLTFVSLLVVSLIIYIVWRFHYRLFNAALSGSRFITALSVMIVCCALFVISGRKKLIPTYPLTELSSAQSVVAQNSFHTFIYSVYRRDDGMVKPFDFISNKTGIPLFRIKKQDCTTAARPEKKKNIVLFIMESVPAEFFDVGGTHKVKMPFLDSIVAVSRYFDHAYSYSHNSNKGIVAILAGIPTLTEIPLYHSNYASMELTPVGRQLAHEGYASSFFIGDNFDDFGFAKCVNWLGIQRYYSRDDISRGNKIEYHTMGVHDQYVLNFMEEKLAMEKEPFFSVHYNISTHFPYDLPLSYKEKYPAENFSAQMRCMNYYSESLRSFFLKAGRQPWFENTLFIFCSDHWLYPGKPSNPGPVKRFRIPIFIFDPAMPKHVRISYPVSQLDIMNTIICAATSDDPVISYGSNLLHAEDGKNRYVFCKENSGLYQVIDSSYVLGFYPETGKTAYCYNFRADSACLNNISASGAAVVDTLSYRIKCFLQEASIHYNKYRRYR